jgi:hypothetical protein
MGATAWKIGMVTALVILNVLRASEAASPRAP